jgi:hypothetical protein
MVYTVAWLLVLLGRSRLTTRVQQRRDGHQHARSNKSHPAPQQMCQAANIVCHHRTSHTWLTNVVLVRLAVLITGRRIFYMLSPTLERPESPPD